MDELINESNSEQSIEVNGIKFETLVPEPIVTIPKPGERTFLNLGVRITNISSISYRFDIEQFYPELLTSKEQLIQGGINKNVTPEKKDSDIPLISPEEEIKFLLELYLIWFEPNMLIVRGEMYGVILEFSSHDESSILKILPSSYRIRFRYINVYSEKQMFLFSTGRTQVKQFWQGEVITPFRNLLIQSI